MDDYDDRPPSTPTWVRVTGLVLIAALVLAFVLSALFSVDHGPGLHGG